MHYRKLNHDRTYRPYFCLRVSRHGRLGRGASTRRAGFSNILTASRHELELRDQFAVDKWFDEHRPAYVVHAAGTVGGIHANSTRPADFLYDNLMIHATVLRASWQTDVTKLLYLGSSCIYPRDCPQPIREEYLLTGPLEKTNEAYAIAKIAGLKSCEAYRRQYGCNFISAMPTNLYGPNDNFDLTSSHVLPALIRKFHECRMSGGSQVVDLGLGPTAARVSARRRPGRRLPVPARRITTKNRRSTSAPARI